MTTSDAIVTSPGQPGRPRCTISTPPAMAARSAQPTPTSSAAATTQTPAAIQRVRSGTGPSPLANRATGTAAAAELRRSRAARARHPRTPTAEMIRAIVCGPCAVHCITTATGSSLGAIRQPLKPPSTSCGGPRSTPLVVADHASLWPSPRTSQQPSPQPSIFAVRLVRSSAVTSMVAVSSAPSRRPSTRTTRSMGRPVPAVRSTGASRRGGPARRVARGTAGGALDAVPARSSAVVRGPVSGTASPSIFTRSSRSRCRARRG